MVHGIAGGVVWTVLAFVLWVLLSATVRRFRLEDSAAAVAVLSWIGAGLLVWLLLPTLDWLLGLFHAGTARVWR